MSDFMKIRPAEVEFFHADEQTDMTKLTAAFSHFCERAWKARLLESKQCTGYTHPGSVLASFHPQKYKNSRVKIGA